ncbi:Crp/Fnr family transcriptional regulator [Aerococcus urinaeequi]|uniref:Crp/Fnr family transcriptional regulator n=1 Tax=Aerococcus urinaeequi TaxID=51665 RepID=UPI00366E2EE1
MYKRNEVVYATNTEARYFLFVLTGKVKIFRLSELGNEQIIRMIAPMEFTGELALFEGIRKAHAVAMVKSEIYLIENQQFKQLLVDYPQLSLKMIEALSQRLHASEEQSMLLSTCPQKTGYSISFVRKPSW